jgi:PTH2 family peptidyl-tRNA hydrolase
MYEFLRKVVRFLDPKPNVRLKQVIVIRKDLGMRKGKFVSQGAHASQAATLTNLLDWRVIKWLSNSFAKITVSVDSEEELLELYDRAKDSGQIAYKIVDSGRTEFKGVPTLTCIVIGPGTEEDLNPITGDLKLL